MRAIKMTRSVHERCEQADKQARTLGARGATRVSIRWSVRIGPLRLTGRHVVKRVGNA